MADTKVSALAAITGATLADGDLLSVVDVSDATMAASGTNKSVTKAELALAYADDQSAIIAAAMFGG